MLWYSDMSVPGQHSRIYCIETAEIAVKQLTEGTVYVYTLNFVSIGLFCRPLAARNPHILPFLDQRFVASPIGGVRRTLNTAAKLQTVLYPTVAKLFLYSNVFKAKSCAQLTSFTSLTTQEWRTDKKFDVYTIAVAACEIRGSPNSAWW